MKPLLSTSDSPPVCQPSGTTHTVQPCPGCVAGWLSPFSARAFSASGVLAPAVATLYGHLLLPLIWWPVSQTSLSLTNWTWFYILLSFIFYTYFALPCALFTLPCWNLFCCCRNAHSQLRPRMYVHTCICKHAYELIAYLHALSFTSALHNITHTLHAQLRVQLTRV